MDKPQRLGAKAEDWVATKFRGRKTIASGSGTKMKGDVITDHEVFEVKATDKASFALKLSDLMRVRTAAVLESKRPIFHITFNKTTRRVVTRWVVLSEADYEELSQRAYAWSNPLDWQEQQKAGLL